MNETYERQALSCLLHNPLLLEDDGLTEDDFQTPKYRAVYTTMLKVRDLGLKIDLVTLGSHIDGSAAGLADLDPVTSANFAFYVDKLRFASRRRRVDSMIREAHAALADSGSEAALESIETGLTKLDGSDAGAIRTLVDVLHPVIDIIEERRKGRGALPGMTTGYRSLDGTIGGMLNGTLVIIAARPSVGKTALAMSMALRIAEKGAMVGFFSAEMTAEQIIMRAVAGVGRVPGDLLATGLITERDVVKVVDASGRLANAQMLIDDTANISLVDLKRRARKMHRLGAKIIFIDYLTLIRHGDAKTPLWQRVGEISKQLKQLARELRIPIVALSQVRRDAEERPPNLADLRQSGEIEEDADVIVLLHRDRDAAAESGDHTTEVHIAKNRHGATGTVNLMFVPQFVTFEEIQK